MVEYKVKYSYDSITANSWLLFILFIVVGGFLVFKAPLEALLIWGSLFSFTQIIDELRVLRYCFLTKEKQELSELSIFLHLILLLSCFGYVFVEIFFKILFS